MLRRKLLLLGMWASVAQADAVLAAAADGKALYVKQCLICHSVEKDDAGGGQGPSLAGLLGRSAGALPGFGYTQALRDSHLVWDAATLDNFLRAPGSAVPGTAMAIAVPSDTERAALIEYFQSLTAASAGAGSPAAEPVFAVPAATRRSADWREDAPGRRHRIRLTALPQPFATPSTRNASQLVTRPRDAELKVPPGFHIDTFVSGLAGPRKMLVGPNGDVLVSETRRGRISVLHAAADGKTAAGSTVFLDALKQPFGLAFYPNAVQPEWLYVAETHRVTRYAYHAGDVNPHAAPEIVAELPHGAGHFTRDIAFSPDGKTLYVSVGSASNIAESMSKKTAAETATWDRAHGLGAAWDEETDRAAVLQFDVAAPSHGRAFATGIRNCVSLAVQPANGALWCTTNERDLLGDDLVPDYSTRVREGGFYGWPWYYFGAHEDPRLKGERPDLRRRAIVPDVPYQAHSAALNLTFYTSGSGAAAFPAEYVGDGFAALHGSWNRSLRTGSKLVRVRMKHDQPTGEYEDFVTGFIVDDASVWGRPVATVELKDGSLLLSDDGANVIYRISYSH